MGMIGKNLLEEIDFEMGKLVLEIVSNYGGKGGGKKDYGQGFIENKNLSVEDMIKCIKDKLNIN